MSERHHILMVYDIPQNSGIANPSAKLRGRGVRINLSAWVFEQGGLPTELIEELKAKGAEVELIRFDIREAPTILKLAKKALESEMEKIRSLMDKALATAREKFDEAKKQESGDLVDKAKTYIKGRVREAKKRLAAATAASMTFEVWGDLESGFESLKEAIRSQQESFFIQHSIEERRKKQKVG